MGQKLSGLRGLFRFMEGRRIEGPSEGDVSASSQNRVTRSDSSDTCDTQGSLSMECLSSTDDTESNISSSEGACRKLTRPIVSCPCPNLSVSSEAEASGYGAIGAMRPRKEGGSGESRSGKRNPPRVKTKSSKDGAGPSGGSSARKKRSTHWAYRLNGKLKGSVIKTHGEVEIPEPNMGGEACICTGYRRTEEHLLGPGIVFEAEETEGQVDPRRPGPSRMREPDSLASVEAGQRSGAEILQSAAGAIIDFLPIEDCDELARLERAREIAEGVDPPPGFRPRSKNSGSQAVSKPLLPPPNIFPLNASNLVNQRTAASGPEVVDIHTLTAMFQTRLGVPAGSLNSGGGSLLDDTSAGLGNVVHTQVDYIHCLVPDLLRITACSFYWGKMDRYEAERLLDSRPEGTFLLRDSAQEEHLFSVSFRKYGRSLHARVEQWNHRFSFDCHDPGVFASPTVTGLVEHYKDPACCMFFEPMLTLPLHRSFPFPLQHLCRAVVCSRTSYDAIASLRLPKALKAYLKEYHYKQRVRVRRFDSEH
ncbi:suppressor of cytokine signaling 5 [Ischnura elegans]|uniref:suppressor of cytokine signaling 5 n=1 Tax=Ischnura elegans TaxID=197161 RepID=UPI001ED8B02F|nr:suppressor of cytokine signaling 5 [Ischnura elegans]